MSRQVLSFVVPSVAVALAILVSACSVSAGRAGESLSNTVTWSTASESDNFGFDVYRAERRDGPYERITARPLEGGGTTDLPRDYRFVDEQVEPGVEYFYYVESISLSGERRRFTPIMRAAPKYPGPN